MKKIKQDKETVSISIDKTINEEMECSKVNKSKLINHLLKQHLKEKKLKEK